MDIKISPVFTDVGTLEISTNKRDFLFLHQLLGYKGSPMPGRAEVKGWWQSLSWRLSLQPHGLEILLLRGTPSRLYLRTSKDLPNSSIP